MNKIRKLEAKGKRFRLTLSTPSGERVLSIHQEAAIQHDLLKHKPLDDEALRALKADDAYYTALDKAFTMLASKPRSEREIHDSLLKQSDADTAGRAIDYLREHGYLDDYAALKGLVEDALERGRPGPCLLRQRALERGFAAEEIEAALAHYDAEAERKNARALLESELRSTKRLPLAKLKRRLMETCVRRGFNYGVCEDAAKDLASQAADDIDEEALLETRIEKLKDRYDLEDPSGRRRLISKLLREGFTYDSIKKQME